MFFNENQNLNERNMELKYGDADLASKRRKQTPNDYKSDQYENFEKISCNDILNSTFKENVHAKYESDYKGGILDLSKTSDNNFLPSSANCLLNTSSPSSSRSLRDNDEYEDDGAQSLLTITTKPSLTSRGFQNTFNMLKNSLNNNTQKTFYVLQSLSANGSSSLHTTQLTTISERDESPTRLELELEAKQRVVSFVKQSCWDHEPIFLPFVSFLYEFAAKSSSSNNDNLNDDKLVEKLQSRTSDTNPDLMYHVAKSIDGKNCLKIVRSLLQKKGKWIINAIKIFNSNKPGIKTFHLLQSLLIAVE